MAKEYSNYLSTAIRAIEKLYHLPLTTLLMLNTKTGETTPLANTHLTLETETQLFLLLDSIGFTAHWHTSEKYRSLMEEQLPSLMKEERISTEIMREVDLGNSRIATYAYRALKTILIQEGNQEMRKWEKEESFFWLKEWKRVTDAYTRNAYIRRERLEAKVLERYKKEYVGYENPILFEGTIPEFTPTTWITRYVL